MNDFNIFKIRASAVGQIMTNARTKKQALSQTAKSYCENWLKEQISGRRKEIDSKYLKKGIAVEEEAISFLVERTDLPFMKKNETSFENQYCTGTPDVIDENFILDIKSSWDFFTFPLFEKDINKSYYWQLQTYMWLTGIKKAKLAYVLINTPESLIEKEIFYSTKDMQLTQEQYNIISNSIKRNNTFDDLKNKYRIKIYDFDFDETIIGAIKTRVEECRIYINELLFTL